MSLVTLKEVLKFANENNCAVPAFNIDFMEGIQAIIKGAEEEGNYPVILNIGQGAIGDGKLKTLAMLAREAAEKSKVPVVIHLDHGKDYAQAIRCLCAGYTSVMIDGSHLPLEENIALTSKVVEAANAVGVSVEAELGVIGGMEDNLSVEESQAMLVDVEEVKKFTAAVKVDALAVGIGNVHGLYKGEPKLAFDRLSQVCEVTDVPLVLHGGSGIPDEMIRRAISMGVRKINVATEVRLAYIEGVVKVTADKNGFKDIYKVLESGRQEMMKVVKEKINLFRR